MNKNPTPSFNSPTPFKSLSPKIELSSPKLKGTLERIYPENVVLTLKDAYKMAMSSGGATEIDFKREEGVSFNPLPARVALIQLDEAKLDDPETLKTSILHSIDRPKSDPASVRLFHWFDRARHAHLANSSKKVELMEQLLIQSEKHLAEAVKSAPALVGKIELWQSRAQRLIL